MGPGAAATAAADTLPTGDHLLRLALVAKALGDPIRLRMLALMVGGRTCCGLPEASSRGVPGTTEPAGVCVCEFQEQLGLAQSKTSYHLRVLKDAGLISEEARGKWSFYEPDGAALASAIADLETLLGVSTGCLPNADDAKDPGDISST